MRSFLLGKMLPFKNNLVKVTEYQQTDDIIKELLKGHKKWSPEYDKISGYFWKGTPERSLKYTYDYLKKNVKYHIEPDTRQSIKSPAAIIATGPNGYNDCKHYSSFFGGMIDSWNRKKLPKKPINWSYRFANYKLMNDKPHHVFVVAKMSGNEVWCDAVLNSFNEKKPYLNKIDKIPEMALYQISGVGGCGCGCGGNCQESFYGIPSLRQAKKQKRIARRSGEHCKGRRITKYLPIAIAGRKAFLFLIRLNVRKLGFKMYHVLKNPKTRVKALETWCKMGGDADMLVKTVNRWKVKYQQKHPGMIGFDPGSITAAIVAASPYITAFAPIITLAAKFLPQGQARDAVESVTASAQELSQNVSGLSGISDLQISTANSDVNFRKGPGIGYGVIAYIKKGGLSYLRPSSTANWSELWVPIMQENKKYKLYGPMYTATRYWDKTGGGYDFSAAEIVGPVTTKAEYNNLLAEDQENRQATTTTTTTSFATLLPYLLIGGVGLYLIAKK